MSRLNVHVTSRHSSQTGGMRGNRVDEDSAARHIEDGEGPVLDRGRDLPGGVPPREQQQLVKHVLLVCLFACVFLLIFLQLHKDTGAVDSVVAIIACEFPVAALYFQRLDMACERRITTARELLFFWNSEEMTVHREKAIDYIVKREVQPNDERHLFYSFHRSIRHLLQTPEVSRPPVTDIYPILYFFHMWGSLRAAGEVDDNVLQHAHFPFWVYY
mmetsp:Transcript_15521/g.48547  ORF Transcript_15521/g.48547 Transcript_15521/m.48547 type:complete len:216 (-) Transcript_15521:597-1244(-)